MKQEIKYSLGLDLGIASIGWGVVGLDENDDPTHIIDTGVVVVESMEEGTAGNLKNAGRRAARGARRGIRRKQHRVVRTQRACKSEFNMTNKEIEKFKQHNNVHELKVKALSGEKLTELEFTACMINYVKSRGFKSNRKDGQGEDGVILESIKENEEKLNGMYPSEYILRHINGIDKIKNTGGKYEFAFNRSTWKNEVEAFLMSQDLDPNFRAKLLEIWESQRDFSEGPGGDSVYAVNFANTFGSCKHDGKLRAPRFSYSQEYNTLLSKLINITFREIGEYRYDQKLNKEQIQKLMIKGMNSATLSYSEVVKVIGRQVEFKNNKCDKVDYAKSCEKRDELGLNPLEFKTDVARKANKNKIVKITATNEIRKAFKKFNAMDLFEKLSIEKLDDIATGLTFYKTTDRIEAYFTKTPVRNGDVVSNLDWSCEEIEIIHTIKDVFKESGSLSLDILRDLNKIMIENVEYSEAMNKLGYNHSKIVKSATRKKHLDSIIKILDEQYPNEVSNPRVKRVLEKTASLINSIVDSYGSPYVINVEVARDINLKLGNRRKLEAEMMSNMNSNERIKAQILDDNPQMNYSNITKIDIEKYKLFHEQDGKCAYTGELISKGEILTGLYEIDHIIPYSRCNINSMVNKTLVTKKANQEKGNKLPYEYMSADQFTNFTKRITENHKINDKKKQYYLLKTLDGVDFGHGERALNDTRFITKYLVSILENNLEFSGDYVRENGSTRKLVQSYKAGYVSNFKRVCDITNLTHSLDAEDYRRVQAEYLHKIIFKKDSIAFECVNTEAKLQPQQIEIKTVKENKYTKQFEKDTNTHLATVLELAHEIDEVVMESITNKKFYDKHGNSVFDNVELFVTNNKLKTALDYLLAQVKVEYNKFLIEKNRDNHLHHALDALTVASMGKSTEQILARYDKKRGELYDMLEANKTLTVKYNDKARTVSSIDEFRAIEHNVLREFVNPPFENFKDEICAFVYERDAEKQMWMLDDDKIRNVRVLTPVQTKKKRYGTVLHKDTIFGEFDGQATKRISTLDAKKSDFDKIIKIDSDNKGVYEACIKWLDQKKPTEYPTLNNGTFVKRVRIFAGDLSKMNKLPRGYAASKDLVRLDVYEGQDDNLRYFVARNASHIAKIDNNEDFEVSAYYARDKSIEITNSLLDGNYHKVMELFPGNLIDITKGDVNSKVYITGFTGGKIEIGSVLGDNLDIEADLGYNPNSKQHQVPCNIFSAIDKLNISISGNVQ